MQEFAAADADEQVEELPLDPLGIRCRRRLRKRDMGEPQRAGVAAQRRQPSKQVGAGSAREQYRKQRIFLPAGAVDLVDRGVGVPVTRILRAIEIGPQHGAVDAGRGFDRQNAFGRNATPIRHGRLRNADLSGERTDAAGVTDSLLKARIAHLCVCSNEKLLSKTVSGPTKGQ